MSRIGSNLSEVGEGELGGIEKFLIDGAPLIWNDVILMGDRVWVTYWSDKLIVIGLNKKGKAEMSLTLPKSNLHQFTLKKLKTDDTFQLIYS